MSLKVINAWPSIRVFQANLDTLNSHISKSVYEKWVENMAVVPSCLNTQTHLDVHLYVLVSVNLNLTLHEKLKRELRQYLINSSWNFRWRIRCRQSKSKLIFNWCLDGSLLSKHWWGEMELNLSTISKCSLL